MRVVIIGGTGFIGRKLCVLLTEKGHNVVVTSRSPGRVEDIFSGRVTGAEWDGKDADALARILDAGRGPQGVVNLAGENIAAGRWTAERKERILRSRVDAGRALASACARTSGVISAIVQGSAIGIYGPGASREDAEVTEDTPVGEGFLAHVCKEWEAAISPITDEGIRLAIARTGIVLGHGGGVLERFLLPFKMYAGGPLGSGRQWFPWVHAQDETAAIAFLLERSDAAGAFNIAAPGSVTMREFCLELGRVLDRPSWLRVPEFLLKLGAGEMAEEMILSSIRATPHRLVEMGFDFRYPFLREALGDIIND